MDDPEVRSRRAAELFAQITRRYQREYELAAARHGLTHLQAKALLVAEEPVPMREVAVRLHAEPPNVTSMIDKLEALGLVERRADPRDRRVKLIAATEPGRAVVADLRARTPFASRPLGALTRAQQENLLELLELLAEG